MFRLRGRRLESFAIILVIIFAVYLVIRPSPISPSLDDDEYALYSTGLNEIFRESLVVLDETAPMRLTPAVSGCLKGAAQSETVHDFEIKAAESRALARRFTMHKPYVLTKNRVGLAAWMGNLWDRLVSNDRPVPVKVSRIGFNERKDQAFFRVDHACRSARASCSGPWDVVLERSGGWKVSEICHTDY
jgi:hypothetical protein